jgi:protein-tyrosine phosphatase
MSQPSFQQALRTQVFPITRAILQGPFAVKARADDLRAAGVTHVLNVGEAPSVLQAVDGPFHEIAWHPIVDFELIPHETARGCLNTLHRMLLESGSRVYVHCVAGWNRSPTVVWLYLIACGLDPSQARQAIERRSLNAVPAHGKLVNGELIEFVQGHGRACYQPHARPEVLQWTAELG